MSEPAVVDLVLASTSHYRRELLARLVPSFRVQAPLVDEAALIDVLRGGRISAGLDVYDIEPLPAGHPFTTMRNVVLTPHLGYVVEETMRRFYTQSVANILAYLDGAPIRVVTT